MSTLVKFPDVTFEDVSYGTVVSNYTSIQKAPKPTTLTARIIGGNGWVTLTMSADKFSLEPGTPPHGEPVRTILGGGQARHLGSLGRSPDGDLRRRQTAASRNRGRPCLSRFR